MKKLERIITDETVSDMFYRLAEETKMLVGQLMYIEKINKETSLGVFDDNPSYNNVNVEFRHPEIYVKKLEEITNRDNFLAWCNYKDFIKYYQENNFVTNFSATAFHC